MTQSGNNNYNTIISKIKLNDRKDPESTVKIPYTYMIAVEDRLAKFLQRMSENKPDDNPPDLNGLISDSGSFSKLYKFKIMNILPIYLKPYGCHKSMKPLYPAAPGFIYKSLPFYHTLPWQYANARK